MICCCLVLLCSACSSSSGGTATPTSSIPTPTATQTSVVTKQPSPTPIVTTAPVPTTQTSCPPAGTARAAVMAPLALGNHSNIVFLATKNSSGSSITTTFNRYDVVTGTTTAILTLPNEVIRDPQISADGQWILFVQSTIQQDKLQMVRMDGQGLQTLYCGSTLSDVIWSSDQHLVLFGGSTPPQGFNGIYLLNVQSGTVQLEVQPSVTNLGSIGMFPLTWLDTTRALINYAQAAIVPFDSLGILDTRNGPNQPMKSIMPAYQDKTSAAFNYPCWDADSSFDASTLFVAQCGGISAPNCSGSCSLGTREGPSAIYTYTQPGTGSSQKTLFTSQTLGIAAVRAATSNLLLLQVENFSQNHQVDTSQNGLWLVHSDGSGLTRLTTETGNSMTALCQYSQTPWSNVSRDGSMYAYETVTNGGPSAFGLSYSSWDGSQRKAFASNAQGTALTVVGWTTM